MIRLPSKGTFEAEPGDKIMVKTQGGVVMAIPGRETWKKSTRILERMLYLASRQKRLIGSSLKTTGLKERVRYLRIKSENFLLRLSCSIFGNLGVRELCSRFQGASKLARSKENKD